MTDEGEGLCEPPSVEADEGQPQVTDGIRPGSGPAQAKGSRMNGTSPQEDVALPARDGEPGVAEHPDSLRGEAVADGVPVAEGEAAGAVAGEHAADGDTLSEAASSSGEAPPSGEAGSSGASGIAGDGGAGARKGRRKRSFWRELAILFAIALALTLVIKTYAIQAFYIPSGSMENTLDIGDRVLVNQLVYDFRGIHRGDIVVFNGDGSWNAGSAPSSNFLAKFVSSAGEMFGLSHGDTDYIKRVIGLPGDHVSCCDDEGRVTVNGVALNEAGYLYPGNAPSETRFSITVPAGQLWVMGDHRAISYDSRDHTGDPGGGTVPESAVLGRAFVVIWPLARWRVLPIPATFEQPKLNASSASALSANTLVTSRSVKFGAVRVKSSGAALPLSLGFAGAIPVSWLQRRLRRRLGRRNARQRAG
jgi:signal peptidase I